MFRIYSKDDCIFCEKAKALFREKNIEYMEFKLGSDYGREYLLSLVSKYLQSGQKLTVPQIFLDNTYIGGYNELEKYLQNGIHRPMEINENQLTKWDKRFLALAKHVAEWSKDPSTKVGSVIVRPDKRVVSLGYNGFPTGVEDDDRLNDRETKLMMISHAERNALDNCDVPVRGYTLYTTLYPCSDCTKSIIQKGITRLVCMHEHRIKYFTYDDFLKYSYKMLSEANVETIVVL